MKIEIGKTYLITTDNWFLAPDGDEYRAVFGVVNSIDDDSDTLGIKTNRGSTNWYVNIGCMVVAGCQIHYAIQCDSVNFNTGTRREIDHEGSTTQHRSPNTKIFNANTDGGI